MVNARNVLILTLVIAVLSMVGAVVSLLGPPDNSEFGADSFGTRGRGFRAIFDMLDELDVSVSRRIEPPDGRMDLETTLVLWAPNRRLTQYEPSYLQQLAGWVERGGRVVIAPPAPNEFDFMMMTAPFDDDARNPLEELGLPGVRVALAGGAYENDPSPMAGDESVSLNEVFSAASDELWGAKSPATRVVRVHAEGSLAPLEPVVHTLELPDEQLSSIESESLEPHGRVVVQKSNEVQEGDDVQHGEKEAVLVAVFNKGRGQIIVVSEPSLVENAHIANADNSVLAAHLLYSPGRDVVFDEFYHGMTVRGNPLYLLTDLPYAVTTLALLAVVGLWIWHQAVFLGPPLPSGGTPRRSITEYVEAMARFLQRGLGSRQFVLREVRLGTLWSLRKQLGLQPGREDVQHIAAALARRNRDRALELENAVSELDVTLEQEYPLPIDTLHALQRVTTCLSRNSIRESANRSPK